MRLSISQKVALPTVAVVLLLQLGLGSTALEHEENALWAQLDARAANLARLEASCVANGQQRDNRQTAQALGQAILTQDDVLFCEVKGPGQMTLFQGGTRSERGSREYSFPIKLRSASEIPGESTNRAHAGTLSFAMTTTDIDCTMAEARGTVVVALLAGAAMSLLLVVLIVRYTIGNTLTPLLQRLRLMSIGRECGTIAPHLSNELDQLAEASNDMTQRLQAFVERERQLTTRTISEPAKRTRSARH